MKESYSHAKYAWSAAGFTAAVLITLMFMRVMTGFGLLSAEFWILLAMIGGLLWFSKEMIWVMCSPLGSTATWKRDVLWQRQKNKYSGISEPARERFALAAAIAGNYSGNIGNRDSWVRVSFWLLNRELNSPPFPRTV